MNYQESIAYLLSLVRSQPNPSRRHATAQSDVLALLERLGKPHRKFPVIHLAGSKGKGSTAHYIEAILRGAGLKTGLFTSPHLEQWTERVRIEGQAITPERFAQSIAAVKERTTAAKPDHGTETKTSFFDVLTAAACLEFARSEVDVAVVEAGLGGRFDATNIFEPAVCVITTLELEHIERLGKRIESIAWHKAGIARSKKPLLVGHISAAAHRVVSMEAKALDAPLFDVDRFLSRAPQASASGVAFGYRHDGLSLDINLHCPAVHAAYNACLALASVQLSALVEVDRLARCAAQSLANCSPPGRLQLIAGKPQILIDAAHTQASAQALSQLILNIAPGRLRLVLSSSRHTMAPALLELAKSAEHIYVVEAEPLRSLNTKTLKALLRRASITTPISQSKDMHTALHAACSNDAENCLVCITGSTYAAGAALAALHERLDLDSASQDEAIRSEHQ